MGKIAGNPGELGLEPEKISYSWYKNSVEHGFRKNKFKIDFSSAESAP